MHPQKYPDERESVIHKVRLHTIYRRNAFLRSDCESVVSAILRRFDHLSEQQIGFRLSSMFESLISVYKKIEHRFNHFFDLMRKAHLSESEEEISEIISFYCSISLAAKRCWALCERSCRSLEGRRWVAFQLSELCNSWIYTLEKDDLRVEFGSIFLEFLEKLSIKQGELSALNPQHIFMNNPVWRRPFIALGDGRIFLGRPGLLYGFPFQIFEQFVLSNSILEKAYSEARSEYLEEVIFNYVSSAFPSGSVFRHVMWRDPVTNKEYENDVLAIIGNIIFLFEAKSGRLDDVAKRGGELSLLTNFKELFVEPGEQATRLESYLNSAGPSARLWLKGHEGSIALNLDRPKIVHKFTICFEHFDSLTSAKYYLKILGAVTDESAWAPVLSLGELMLIYRHLDTEISFFHYLTRRATFDDLVDFEGDELDILSLYLINGLCLDQEALRDRKLHFIEIDGIVKKEKTPRRNRKEFEVYGVPLSEYWKGVLREIYEDESFHHRFDALQTVLNQDPHSLAGIESQIRRWRKGGGGRKNGDILFSKFKIGNRVFVLGYYLLKHRIDGEEWVKRSRNIAWEGAVSLFEASDCVTFLRVKRSKDRAFDALSFHRFIARPAVTSSPPSSQ
jgi:hypothetical protein